MTLYQPSHPSSSESTPAQQPAPLPTQSTNLTRSDLATQPLIWLWPGRIPQGKLTLLDGSLGCGTTLFAVTLAACVSTGRPWPDGTACPQGNVLFIAPHDNFRDTLLPRLRAAGARDDHVMSLAHVADSSPNAPHQARPFSLLNDFALLESTITSMRIALLILDPYTAIPGWRRTLPALIELAQRTHCAIVLTRSLSRAPSDPLHPHCLASPVLTAARSHLLLAPDPSDERQCLLLTPKHSLCTAPPTLAYAITSTDHDIPILTWLPAPDPTHLRRLCTGPIRSPQRQAILHFLREQPDPCQIKTILRATCYDYEAGRKMLVRMKMAGELVSLGSGLYTTSDHPCLTHSTPESQSSVPVVPNDSTERGQGTPVGVSVERSGAQNQRSAAGRINPSCPSSIDRLPTDPNDPQADLFTRLIASGEEALAQVKAHLAASGYPMPTIPLTDVPCPNNNLSQNFPPTRFLTTLPPSTLNPTSKKTIEPVPDVSNESPMISP